MLRRNLLLASVGAATHAVIAHAAQDAAETVPDNWEKRSLLGGRFSALLPESATERPQSRGAMAATTPTTISTRYFFQVAGKKTMLGISELFAVSDLSNAELMVTYLGLCERRLPGIGFAGRWLSSDRGQGALLAQPSRQVKPTDGYLAANGLARHTDNSLIELTFISEDPEAIRSSELSEAITRLISSVEIGSRSLPNGKALGIPSTPISIDVPQGFTAYGDIGPDFWVTHVLSLPKLGQNRSGLLLYLGHNPSPPIAPRDAPARPAQSLGLQSAWHDWHASNGLHYSESRFRHETLRSMTAHILVTAQSESARSELCNIAASARTRFAA